MLRPQGVALLAVACAADIPAEHATQLTMYHLNPLSAGALPVNMDSGDAEGDLNFYLGEFLLPLECANKTAGTMAGFDCSNPERVDPNLVVTKVVMEVDNRFTTYSACNLCNGTDPFNSHCDNPDPVTHRCPCKVGTYVCDCFSRSWGHQGQCDSTKVGAESRNHSYLSRMVQQPAAQASQACGDLLESECGKVKNNRFMCGLCEQQHKSDLAKAGCSDAALSSFCGGSGPAPSPSHYSRCGEEGAPDWECWRENLERKVGGYWYSTLAEGQCNSTGAPCGWKMQSMKTVHEPCLKDKLMTTVEKADPDCFSGCGARNATSPCWIGCFMDTLLGKGARTSSREPLGGLPKSTVISAWEASFDDESGGGCPTVKSIN